MTTCTAPQLSERDRHIVSQARELAGAHSLAELRAAVGASPELNVTLVHGDALGIAQHLLAELVGIAERLGGGNG
jgi:hypothetical protein